MYEIYPNLYQDAAPLDPKEWDTIWQQVDIVVSAWNAEHPPQPIPNKKVYLQWSIEDGPLPDEGLLITLSSLAASFVCHGRKVLIQCGAGCNRSSLLTCLVLMLLTPMSGKEAIAHLEAKKPGMVLINHAYREYIQNIK